MKYDLLIGMLQYLARHTDYVSGKDLAFALHTSEKTILKYLNILKDELKDNGAEIDIKQGMGSRIVIHDQNCFQKYLSSFSQKENGILSNPQARKTYVLVKLLTNGSYIDLYELADELYISPSLLRSIIKNVSQMVSGYSLSVEHSQKNGYRITGDEKNIRRCLSQECRDIQNIISTISNTSGAESEQLTYIIADSLHHYGISMADSAINSLKLHILIAINRIETEHTIQFEDSFDLLKMKGTPEYFVATHICKKLQQLLNITFPENEMLYLTMHINGKQRLYGHQLLQVKVSEDDIIFYNRFLRNIYRLADVDFFDDGELRVSLLNHIVPFRNRIKNDMQIRKKNIDSIRNSFPFAYELATLGLSMFEKNEISPSETAYFSLHLELSLEKHLQAEQQYNLTVITDEITGLYQIISFKLNKQLGNMIGKIQFTDPSDIENYIETTDLFINITDKACHLPKNSITISPFMTTDEIDQIRSFLSTINSEEKMKELLNPSFFMEIDAKSRKDAIDQMIEKVSSIIYLPSDYHTLLIQREELGTTEYGNCIAVPHAISHDGIPDFLAVGKLKKPILWKEKEVSLIFMLSSSSSKTSSWFLERVGKAVQSPSISKALMDTKDYKSFMNTFLSI